MSLLNLPLELVSEIAGNLDPYGLQNLIEAYPHLNALLVPILEKLVQKPALFWAVCLGLVNFVKVLLDTGVEINARDDSKQTPLHLAARKRYPETEIERNEANQAIIKLLLESGADINTYDEQNLTAFHHTATMSGEVAVIKIFLDHGCDIDHGSHNYGQTALHLAAQFGNLDAAKFLLEQGANINICTRDGTTALHTAASGSYYPTLAVMSLLLEKGANVTTTDHGDTPLHCIARGYNCHPCEAAKVLLGYHVARINAQNNKGQTALHLACRSGPENDKMSLVGLLLEEGADFSIQDTQGHIAFEPFFWGSAVRPRVL